MGFVYTITNRCNNKIYVGKTRMNKVELRWKDHRNKLRRNVHINLHLQRSYNLYGESAFCYEVVYQHDDEAMLLGMESVLIEHFNSINPAYGYNMTTGGETSSPSEKVRLKLSLYAKQRTGSKNPFYGKSHTQDTKSKIGMASAGRKLSESSKQLLSAQRRGIAKTSDHKQNISTALKGKPKSDAAKENMRLAWQRRKEKNKPIRG